MSTHQQARVLACPVNAACLSLREYEKRGHRRKKTRVNYQTSVNIGVRLFEPDSVFSPTKERKKMKAVLKIQTSEGVIDMSFNPHERGLVTSITQARTSSRSQPLESFASSGQSTSNTLSERSSTKKGSRLRSFYLLISYLESTTASFEPES